MQPKHPMYNMDFPDYEFKEYPKWVTLKNGKQVIAANQHEELRLLSMVEEDGSDVLDPVAAERDALAEKVAELNDKLAAAEAANLKANVGSHIGGSGGMQTKPVPAPAVKPPVPAPRTEGKLKI